jgi:hypothetical protein
VTFPDVWLAVRTDFEIIAGFLHDSVVPLTSVLCQQVLPLLRHRFFCVSADEYPKGYSFGAHFNVQFGLSSHVYLQPLMMFVSDYLHLLYGLQAVSTYVIVLATPIVPLLRGFYCRNLGLIRAIIPLEP